ncbi:MULTISPECIES: ABC transporter ATP-binding protein [Thermoanaerobacterium]|uniref:ABC-type quaternary amine transporter n=1 Tax=Thermoanaerobacterium thermosaccharolyticum M0795 TaxID=698948 RepID=L0II49_THETR|nr:ABC-type nitrate/sulfonate/bicarbonate transport system, ATPase component [Thermoanaerobacterium thermosaccharolyticum M0795]KAA5807156.1 ABC transporter ATP-binding protein [Thermoanaerobacterium thermosaccharolyticum]SNX54760.1 NitT/TauT family transport system ATP-binding protein [Thermoanaerobacterium sp. RBIITD]
MSLVIENISKSFMLDLKTNIVLDNVNLLINKGEFICIIGPSGCGKSTLLNIIAGLESASCGRIILNGSVVKDAGIDRAVMFQEPALFPWLTVIDNVEFGMKMAGIKKEERKRRAMKYLKMVHLTKFKDSYIHQLSGGMMQRVALARALAIDSEVLLMDEPFSALDSQTRDILQLELQRIWMDTKKTIVFVTHNIEEAVVLADRVVVMSTNPGRVKKEFKIELSRPRKPESPDVNYYVREIMDELREEVEKVAKSEYDGGWSVEKDLFLSNVDSNMGIGL